MYRLPPRLTRTGTLVPYTSSSDRGLLVIIFPRPTDRFGKCGERRRFKALLQCLVSNCPADTTIAVLKGMDRFKPQMPDSRARDCRQRLCPCGRTVVDRKSTRLNSSH